MPPIKVEKEKVALRLGVRYNRNKTNPRKKNLILVHDFFLVLERSLYVLPIAAQAFIVMVTFLASRPS